MASELGPIEREFFDALGGILEILRSLGRRMEAWEELLVERDSGAWARAALEHKRIALEAVSSAWVRGEMPLWFEHKGAGRDPRVVRFGRAEGRYWQALQDEWKAHVLGRYPDEGSFASRYFDLLAQVKRAFVEAELDEAAEVLESVVAIHREGRWPSLPAEEKAARVEEVESAVWPGSFTGTQQQLFGLLAKGGLWQRKLTAGAPEVRKEFRLLHDTYADRLRERLSGEGAR